MIYLVLLSMLFLHLIADYNLQGVLAQFKQKEWWKKNYPQPKYKRDWIIALIEHSFMWSFLVCLPVFVYMSMTSDWETASYLFIYCIILNTGIHATIDNEKANNGSLSLFGDQFLHFVQIFATWLFLLIK